MIRLSILAMAATIAAGGPALAADAAAKPAPKAAAYALKRTSWGDPDLRGVWPIDSVGMTPVQRAERYGTRGELTDEEYAGAEKAAARQASAYDREEKAGTLGMGHWAERGQALRQTSLTVEPANGRIPPLTEAGKAWSASLPEYWIKETFDSLADFHLMDRCITRGLPSSMLPFPYNNGLRIFQGPGYLVMQLEIVHETRIIPLDGRPALPGQIRPWLGSSRGHFEGSSLVIETTNFNGQTAMSFMAPSGRPIPASKSMRIVERITPVGPDTLQYEATISDPVVLTAPWKLSFPLTRNDRYKLFEYACHEGNTVVQNYIRSTSPRYAEQRKAALAARQ